MTVACKIEPAYAVESKALADYDHLLGRVVLTTKISGYVGSDSVSLNLSTPAKVQITATDQASLLHWNDDWCDPYWNVTLVEPHVELDGVRSLWMIQANNTLLVDKFHTITELTVPAWKRQFMLSLTLREQRNAVELATKIDDTTNDLLKRNAELLHRNSVETARANQRLVIDVETLKQVQETLIKTVEEVIRIQRDGVEKRQNAEKEIQGMRVDMQKRLVRSDERKVLH